MSLLVPLFLAGLAAVAVPILVHLVHRERAQAERFPSAMFLRREPYRAMARQRLRHPFLFAMRVLAVALLAFAFSRPFFRGSAGATRLSERGRDVAILLDRSASMGYAERWQRATAAVERTLQTLGAEDRVALIAFDTRAVALTALAGDRNGVRQALAAERPSARSTRYAPALQLAKRLLDEGGRARAEVVLVSDFQRSGWDLRDGPVLNAEQRLTPVDVSEADLSNLAWRGVSVERDSVGSGDAVRVLGRLANTGAARRGVRATLAIGPREIAEQRVDLPADAGAIVTFAGVRAAANANAARLVVHGDSHALDDTLRLVLARPRDVRVLLVEPDAGAAAAQRGFFLREALALGTEPQFAVQVRAHEALTSADVGAADVIVLHDAAWPAGAVARRLTERVSSGAGLVVALGERSRESSWARTPQGVLPLSLPPIVDRSAGRGGTMSWIDQTHAALETFTGGRSGDLSSARFARYRAVGDSLGRVLARFDDGSAALVERRLAQGRVLVWGASFGPAWSDFPRQPVFLPFVHEIIRYASGYRSQRVAEVVGTAIDLNDALGGGLGRTQAVVAVAPSGRRQRLEADGASRRPLALDEAGFFTLDVAGVPGERATLVAANIDPRETELETFDPVRLTDAVTADDGSARGDTPSEVLSAQERERRQSLWWWLLLALTVVLGVEALAAARASGAALHG